MIVMRHGDRMTLSEYRLTPENDGVWDLIDGVLEKQPLATLVHQMILGDLLSEINNYTSETDPPLGYGISNIGVAFSESFAPTPDIVYARWERLRLMRGSFMEGTPDLLVEVLSEDRDRDLIRKRDRYAAAGVPEYWIVDTDNEVILVLELSGGQYTELAFGRGDALITSTIPGFELPLERIFGDPILEQLRNQQDDDNVGARNRGGQP